MHEWMTTFRRIEIPIDPDVQNLQHIVLNPIGNSMSRFENTKLFDDIVKAIARNRKHLICQFSELDARGVPLDFHNVKTVLYA